ncbi:UNVERIFIED_CONTAM: hypothetical protein Sradi_1517200 [Sesamum radiatum]|uniref:GDSL esterase/lipase n=1 Tax=Sesamum radiatum TaxID=300843 RepID=A0AAW2U7E7_SESRA
MMYCKNSVVGGFLFLIAFACWINAKSSEAFGTFGFDIHHRYSDTVKDFLDVDGLPEKGSLDYYAAMAHRDQLFKARRLATSSATTPLLTFLGGNDTYRLSSLGFNNCIGWLSFLFGGALINSHVHIAVKNTCEAIMHYRHLLP